MVDGSSCNILSSTRIGVKTPPLLLPFSDCLTYVLMMTYLNAFILFQLNLHLCSYSLIPVSYMLGYNSSAKSNQRAFFVFCKTKDYIHMVFVSIFGSFPLFSEDAVEIRISSFSSCGFSDCSFSCEPCFFKNFYRSFVVD